VPFVSEDPAKVAQEVPDFHYYVFPDAPGSHKYASLSLGELLFKDPAPTNLPQPGYQYSQLENGLKIVSVDKGGDMQVLDCTCRRARGSRHRPRRGLRTWWR